MDIINQLNNVDFTQYLTQLDFNPGFKNVYLYF